MRRFKKPDQKTLLGIYMNDLEKEYIHWYTLAKTGCNDPYWCDGVNLNLTRNHIIYDKQKIVEVCQTRGLPLPSCCFRPLPPRVSQYYMAPSDRPEQVKRCDRFAARGDKLIDMLPAYDRQISLV